MLGRLRELSGSQEIVDGGWRAIPGCALGRAGGGAVVTRMWLRHGHGQADAKLTRTKDTAARIMGVVR